ncbi:hypothetical protein SODALDRAFT_309427 [Sodiomyces alkalinus F11]|uniref:ATP synthase F(0) complex subunit e, mitochondrial n=1 Tax=Sodiomyces alkalinus (strain CBS 110278 / VKM F-3762 / F11) TaxID=1314773 RepID=A0A3N2PZ79_SODAK|nr:hypothetical protein SODALDRAFT_309427 [Sodiomyces alkalinus F11]ROT39839.1 hypothetical protein SODALDRAFT_309427 [Sodiomyces alkalinus F11]
MSTSTGVNVLRYTALAAGIFYGFTHQRTITATQRAAVDKKEYEHKLQLINQAKAEWAKKNAPAESAKPASGVITDPMDPKFDLEAFFNNLAKENP